MTNKMTNLDAMSEADLWAWLEANPRASKVQRHYAQSKIAAISHRLAGRITDALRYEQECERLYATMPKRVRW